MLSMTDDFPEPGPRSDRPLVTVNCSSIPKDLVESQLFDGNGVNIIQGVGHPQDEASDDAPTIKAERRWGGEERPVALLLVRHHGTGRRR